MGYTQKEGERRSVGFRDDQIELTSLDQFGEVPLGQFRRVVTAQLDSPTELAAFAEAQKIKKFRTPLERATWLANPTESYRFYVPAFLRLESPIQETWEGFYTQIDWSGGVLDAQLALSDPAGNSDLKTQSELAAQSIATEGMGLLGQVLNTNKSEIERCIDRFNIDPFLHLQTHDAFRSQINGDVNSRAVLSVVRGVSAFTESLLSRKEISDKQVLALLLATIGTTQSMLYARQFPKLVAEKSGEDDSLKSRRHHFYDGVRNYAHMVAQFYPAIYPGHRWLEGKLHTVASFERQKKFNEKISHDQPSVTIATPLTMHDRMAELVDDLE